MMTNANTVAVLGLGAMGLPMATCLATEFQVRGYDPRPIEADHLPQTLTLCSTAQDAIDPAGIVLIAVHNPTQLEELIFGDCGIASAFVRGTVVLLTSTVGGEVASDLAARLAKFDVAVVDAPVSGGPARAGRGDLLIVVGAEAEPLQKVQAVLDLLASTLVVVGDAPGTGQAMKTVNQLLCGVHIAAAAEALALARNLGLNLPQTLAALNAGAAASFMLADRGPRIIDALDGNTPEVLSRSDTFVKDLGIVVNAARTTGVATPVAAAAEQLYTLAAAAGLYACDDSTIATVLSR